ncbi:MAG: DUF1211 domain-containing protein [Acidobacteria bacterium]|nr:MAG: DUF1211 domain-containing protein [Acidobacteriota bacterium]
MERRHEVTRLEGFSDAVFGFALTLLVVSLEVPKDIDHLANQMKGFLPFALMFAMICWIWYEHQRYFRNYGLQDAWVIAVNSFLLFVVLFYVYPLKFLTIGLLGRPLGLEGAPVLGAQSDVVMLLYSSGVVMIFGAFVLLYRHAWSRREALALTPAELVTLRFSKRAHILSASLGVVSIGIVLIGRAVHNDIYAFFAGILYALMGPIHGWNGYMAGKAHEQLRKAAAAADAKR